MSTDQTTNQEQEQQTLNEDVIYTQLYEKGKVENYTMGEPFSDATRLCLAQGLVDEETLKKYGTFAFNFIYGNMQARIYPGDEGDAKKYLETLKTALKEKSPEELMKYTPGTGDIIAKLDQDIATGEKTEEDKQSFIAGFLQDEQKMYKNFSEGNFATDAEAEFSRLSVSGKCNVLYAFSARLLNTGQSPAHLESLLYACDNYIERRRENTNLKDELKSEKDLSNQGITQITSESAATDNANASQTALENQVDQKATQKLEKETENGKTPPVINQGTER
jgi:hypothetical protein